MQKVSPTLKEYGSEKNAVIVNGQREIFEQKVQDIMSNQERSFNEVKSTVTQNRKNKMPQSMKKFLKDRKKTLQASNTIQVKPPNTKIKTQSNQKLKNESKIELFEIQEPKQQITQNPQVEQTSSKPKSIREKLRKKKAKKTIKATIICSICECQTQLSNQILAFKCKHLYCNDCLFNYIKYKISMFQQVYCPEDGCSGVMDTDSKFFQDLPKKQRRLYRKINNFYLTQTDSSNKLCPKQDCQGVIKVQEDSQKQTCETCKTVFCSKCFLEFHEGMCQQYEVKYMEDNLHYRQCVKCKIVVERIQGCNHMTCKCRYEFCYMCGAKWRHDHICKSPEQEGQDGCDWGESNWDHFCFLIKMPFKFIAITVYTVFWIGLSFSAAPYNLFFFLYWLLLVLFGGAIDFLCDDETTVSQKLISLLLFPFLVIYCIPRGVRLFLERFEQECPFISDGYRCIVRF